MDYKSLHAYLWLDLFVNTSYSIAVFINAIPIIDYDLHLPFFSTGSTIFHGLHREPCSLFLYFYITSINCMPLAETNIVAISA